MPPAERDDSGIPQPIRVGVLTSQDVVREGIAAIVERLAPRMVPVEIGAFREPDVLLYDVVGLHEGDGADLDHWVKETGAIVIAVTRELRPDLGGAALERGAAGAISIGASAEQFVEVIDAAMTGDLDDSPAAQAAEMGTHPGREVGLTLREAEVVGLVVQGRSNRDIADSLFLSINSVKSYVRSAYRKMEVESRSQAVSWGIQHGFQPDSL